MHFFIYTHFLPAFVDVIDILVVLHSNTNSVGCEFAVRLLQLTHIYYIYMCTAYVAQNTVCCFYFNVLIIIHEFPFCICSIQNQHRTRFLFINVVRYNFVFCFGSVNDCYNFIFLSFLQNNWRISTTKKDNQINTHKKRTNDEPLYRYTPLPRDIPNARFVLVIFVCNCVSFVLFIARESSLSLARSIFCNKNRE